MEKRLHRSSRDRMLAGVCGGLGEYFDIDPVLVRIIFLVLVLLHGFGIIAYIILWILMPKESEVGAPPSATIRSNIESMGEDVRSTFQRTSPGPGQPSSPPASGAPPPPVARRDASGAYVLGIILVILGVILLLDNLNLLWWFRFDQYWPLILVAIGIALLLGRRRRS